MNLANRPPEIPLPHTFFENKLGISRITLWRWRQQGLPCYIVGQKLFIKESDMAAFLEARRKQTAPNPSGKTEMTD